MKALIELCSGMSMNEKRYFKTHTHSAASIRLFNIINENPKDQAIDSQFNSREKNYLYESILRSLRAYHSDRSINRIIDDYTHDIDILLAKEMYVQALSRLKKAIKLAKKYDKHIQMLNLLKLERRLAIYMGDGNDVFIKKVNDKISDEQVALDYHMQLERIISQHREGDLRDHKSPFRIHALKVVNQAKEVLPKSFQDSYLYLRVMAFLQIEIGDDEKALVYFNRIKDRFETDFNKLSFSTLDAYSTLNYQTLQHNRLNVIKRVFQPSTYFKEMEKLVEKGNTKQREASRSFVNLLISLTDYCININRPKDGIQFYVRYKERIDKLVYDMDRVEMLYFNIVYLYFMAGDLKQANRILIKYLNITTIRYKYIFKAIQYVNIIVKFEMGNSDYALLLSKRLQNKFKRKKDLSEFDFRLFELINAVITNRPLRVKEEAFNSYFNTLKELREGKIGRKRENLNEFFNFYSWFQHKLYKKKFVPNHTAY